MLIYWTIRITVFLVFVATGYWISKTYKPNQSYWRGVSPLIVIYSLAEGLRWNRETDYIRYYGDFVNGYLFHEDNEWLYSFWISAFKVTGLPFWIGFIFYSFILIFAFLYLIKRFPQVAQYALPLFFLITSMQSENLVRQYFSLSVIIFALTAFYERHYFLMIILILAAFGIHFSASVPIIVILISFLLTHYYTPRKPILPVVFFVFLFFFWNVSYFEHLTAPILKLIPETGTQADGYIQSSTWFNAEGSLAMQASGTEYAGRSLGKTILQFPTYFFIVVAGFFATKNNSFLRMCFWCAYFAILLDIIRSDIQSYLRFFHWVAFFIPIIIGTIYKELHLSKEIKIGSLLFLFVYYVWGLMLSRLFIVEPWGYEFIWDM